ncbi:MAG: hypothetical protein AB1626_01595 [Candidatus Micrarchaeota archaeon]
MWKTIALLLLAVFFLAGCIQQTEQPIQEQPASPTPTASPSPRLTPSPLATATPEPTVTPAPNPLACQLNESCEEGYECVFNKCVFSPAEHAYSPPTDFLNTQTLDCSNVVNAEFCEEYNSAAKHVGYGAYELSSGDFVVLSPFLFKWIRNGNQGVMKILWINPEGIPLLLNEFFYSNYLTEEAMTALGYQDIYVLTEASQVVSGDLTRFTFTNDPTTAINYCSAKNVDCIPLMTPKPTEVVYRTRDFVGIAPNAYAEYGEYLTKSFQNCYERVNGLIGMEPPPRPIYLKFFEPVQGAGCSAGSSISCASDRQTTEYVLRVWNVNGVNYTELVERGYCLGHSAQAHELLHSFVHGTVLAESGVLNEGLATYVQHKTALDDRELTCLGRGFILEGDSEKQYADLNNFTYRGESYQTSACLWDFIEKTYGRRKFLEVIKAIDGTRYKTGTFTMFADVISPVLGEEARVLIQQKFGLTDFTVTKSI